MNNFACDIVVGVLVVIASISFEFFFFVVILSTLRAPRQVTAFHSFSLSLSFSAATLLYLFLRAEVLRFRFGCIHREHKRLCDDESQVLCYHSACIPFDLYVSRFADVS